jgi:hypothetical protein
MKNERKRTGNDSGNIGPMTEMEHVPLEEQERLERILLENPHRHALELRELLEGIEWCYEDRIYRYYHRSFKVFDLQEATRELADALAAIAPEGRPFCSLFGEILERGTGRKFSPGDNQDWPERAHQLWRHSSTAGISWRWPPSTPRWQSRRRRCPTAGLRSSAFTDCAEPRMAFAAHVARTAGENEQHARIPPRCGAAYVYCRWQGHGMRSGGDGMKPGDQIRQRFFA